MNIHDFAKKKHTKEKITLLTCYDYPSAQIIANTAIDCVLVGDTVSMVVHGHENTTMATMDMMILHTKAVARGIKKQFIVSDLPFMSYRISPEATLKNVKHLIQAGAHAVKLEGADPSLCTMINTISTCGIPVMGHIGLTPQSIHALGGNKVQGKSEPLANRLLLDAKNLEKAGCFAMVLECIPSKLANLITSQLSIPTIGIGAGNKTDGQVLVWHDMLGMQTMFNPKFLKRYETLNTHMTSAINCYVEEVKKSIFPSKEHEY
jgi:3-methyl-2-oxobutanoate hydroxymethyltransferase